uniref:Uncharacterized protein AlNc14C46G3727 n=1 Tax=Albugo laibachii Nc14 TaxID=890382 RepID=F0WAK3_9STRA|nr:conserved hypothetical protein [Albugo laibachii Nc14]|eukprot:CCA18174.1 conserved hypothetical protein [Albugo laibachii Nc14]
MEVWISGPMAGILAGCLVFIASLVAVFALLYAGGSFSRIQAEQIGMPQQTDQIKALLYDVLLEKAAALSFIPPTLGDQTLKGELVSIRDYHNTDADAFYHLADDTQYDANESIWKHLNVAICSKTDFLKGYSDAAIDQKHFVLQESSTQKPIGMLSLLHHSPRDLRIEIGNVWIHPSYRGNGMLADAIYSILQFLFDQKYRRIEWRCDGYNVRARRAAHSIGFTLEGVLRKHRIVNNSNYDTAVFAVLNSEWEIVKQKSTFINRRRVR